MTCLTHFTGLRSFCQHGPQAASWVTAQMLLLFFHTGCCVNACSFISSVWKVQAKWHHWWAVDLSCVSSSMVCSYHLFFPPTLQYTQIQSHYGSKTEQGFFVCVCVVRFVASSVICWVLSSVLSLHVFKHTVIIVAIAKLWIYLFIRVSNLCVTVPSSAQLIPRLYSSTAWSRCQLGHLTAIWLTGYPFPFFQISPGSRRWQPPSRFGMCTAVVLSHLPPFTR